MDAAEGEAAFRPTEACAPSRKDAGRFGKRWRKRSCALIEPRSPQSPRRAPPSPALLCFRGFLPRSSAVGGGIRPSSRATWPLLPMRDLAMAGGTGEAAGFADGNTPRVRAFRLDAVLLCVVRKAERAVRPRPFRFAVAMLCAVRKAERAVRPRPFRFAVAMLCAVRKAERAARPRLPP